MNKHFIYWSLKAICATLIVALSLGCSHQQDERQSYMDDAKAFCAVHGSENWAETPHEMSTEEFDKLVIARELDSVKTQKFKDLIKRLAQIQFYRELYPTAKREIEAITGVEWNCPSYEAFFGLKVQPVAPESKELSSLSPDIVVTSSGEYFLDGNLLDLKSGQLREFIEKRGAETPLVIKLEEGVADDALSPLFGLLAGLNVENVSVVSE